EMGKWEMKIKSAILIAAICFAIIPLVVRVGLSDYFMRKDSLERYEKEIISMAKNQESGMKVALDTAKTDMEKLTGYQHMEWATSNKNFMPVVQDFVMQFQNNNTMISAIRIIDKTSGKILAGEGKDTVFELLNKYDEYNDEVLYFDTVAGTETASKNLFFKTSKNGCLIIIFYNVSSARSLISPIIGNSLTESSNDSVNRKIVVADSRGYWSAGIGFFSDFENTYTGVNTASIQDGAEPRLFKFKFNDVDSIGAAVRVGGSEGLIAVASCNFKSNGIFSSVAMPLIIGGAVVLAVLGVIFAIVAARYIAQPLNKIENTLEKIRRGDHEARISTISNNEYGQLSRAFNNLVDEIVVSEDRYKTISDMSDNIIFEWNFKTNEVTFSNNFNKKFSYRPPSDHFGDSFLLKAKVHPDDADRYRDDLDSLEKGKDFERNEYRIKNIYGDFIWILMRTSTIKGKDGKPLKVVGVMVDIDRAKKSEEQLTERASFDALTELYNRETIEQKINTEISLSEMRKSEMAVLFIDVDDFKHYNDNYSHATGDQVLKFVGKTIRESVADDVGFAGRFGGDEFVALVRNAEVNNPATIAQKLIDTLAAGFDADIGERLTVSVSIGIAVIKDDYNTRVEYLIGKADDAMYSVKKSGKSNYAFI
ncbi:MAG: diguanylate cyclase, partial [Oscillospiraceae bacterium]|nr:diguanylate cyclase [Oscillospiraceae bacterium]